VVERALDVLIEKLEKQKLGKTARAQKPRPAKEGAVTRESRRAATDRDGARCAWVDERTGRRCTARAFLEADHVHEKALGGSGKPENIRWLCHAHNRLHAEQTFGREAIEAAIHHRQRKSIRPQKPQLSETGAKALVGLRKLGFREPQARDAVARVASGLGERKEPESLELVLRQALLLLSDSRAPCGWATWGRGHEERAARSARPAFEAGLAGARVTPGKPSDSADRLRRCRTSGYALRSTSRTRLPMTRSKSPRSEASTGEM